MIQAMSYVPSFLRLSDAGAFIDWFGEGEDFKPRPIDRKKSAQRPRVVREVFADEGRDEVVAVVVPRA